MKAKKYLDIIRKQCNHENIKDALILSGIISVAMEDPDIKEEDIKNMLMCINSGNSADIEVNF